MPKKKKDTDIEEDVPLSEEMQALLEAQMTRGDVTPGGSATSLGEGNFVSCCAGRK